jgi:hypothetical protein
MGQTVAWAVTASASARDPAPLRIVGRHLAPDGAVYLFWDARHTQPGRARDLADQLSEKVRLAEFSVNQVLVKDLRPVARFA